MSLNAFSFNEPLMAKTMNLDDLLDFCAEYNFDGVDLTGYYFPNYPQVPTDDYIYHIKRKAHLLGVSIIGTYIPIETLGKGDPKVKVAKFIEEVREAMKG